MGDHTPVRTARLEQAYRRRLAPPAPRGTGDGLAVWHVPLGKRRQGLARLLESDAEGLSEQRDFEPRIKRRTQRSVPVEEQATQLAEEAPLPADLRLIMGRREDCAAQVNNGLQPADWLTPRERLRTLVKRVEVDHHQVKVVFRVDSEPFVSSPGKQSLPACGRRALTALVKYPAG